jgi:nucleotide-binding universal stress UspA family protein
MTTTHPQAQIVVGISTSLSGLAALRFAVNDARRRGIARITAVRAWPDNRPRRSSAWAPNVMKICVGEISAAITTAFVIRPGDVTIQPRVPRGLPGPELVNLVANDSDMIVVGTRRRFRLGLGRRRILCAARTLPGRHRPATVNGRTRQHPVLHPVTTP